MQAHAIKSKRFGGLGLQLGKVPTSRMTIDDVAEVEFESIRNPVTNEVHRAIIELPDVFEASKMEQTSSKKLSVNDGFLSFNYSGTYGSISEVSWKSP